MDPTPEMDKAVRNGLGRLKREFLLRVCLKVLLYNSEDSINHC